MEQVDPALNALTRDVDLMIRRSDLPRVIEVAGTEGFTFRHAAQEDMLLHGSDKKAVNAVHLVFEGERVAESKVVENPRIAPVVMTVHEQEVSVIAVEDLVMMKLSSFRLKDQVHIQALDQAGLITKGVEGGLIEELRVRLQKVRESA